MEHKVLLYFHERYIPMVENSLWKGKYEMAFDEAWITDILLQNDRLWDGATMKDEAYPFKDYKYSSLHFKDLSTHTASKWNFTQKKMNSNFEHKTRNYMPPGSQNMFWINPGRLSEREIAIWSSSLFSDMSIFQFEKPATKTLQINLYLL